MITAAVADDGTAREILTRLRNEKGILRAYSSGCMASSVTMEAKTKPGKLPEPMMARIVEVLVPEDRASEVFDFLCEIARVDEGGRGAVWQGGSTFCTPFELPPGVPDEGS